MFWFLFAYLDLGEFAKFEEAYITARTQMLCNSLSLIITSFFFDLSLVLQLQTNGS